MDRLPLSPLAPRAAVALQASIPATLSRRERLLLARADEISRNVPPSIASCLEACLYLSLLSCGVAEDERYTARRRELALIGSVGFAAGGREEARVSLGLNERLGLLALDDALDERTRTLAARLLAGDSKKTGLVGAVGDRLASLLSRTKGTTPAAPRTEKRRG